MITLSLSDCWQAMKQARWMILISALVFGVLAFAYYLIKPPTYTAEALFKGNKEASSTGISKALEFLGNSEHYSAADDAKVFLRSYPVMEGVARSLNLQLAIREKKRANPLRQIWHTLKAERAQRLIKTKQPDSPILTEPVPSKMMLPDQAVSITCTKLDYPELISAELDLVFLDDKHFHVLQKKRLIGEGELEKPFWWKGSCFTLAASTPVSGKSFHLTFIPLHAAAKSLEKSISVKRSKDHKSLVHVSFTHPNRHLATSVVNSAMASFQEYLKDEGKRKISQQTGYLKQRQQETIGELEAVLEEHKTYLEAHLKAGELFSLGNELEFMAKKQTKARMEREAIAGEIGALEQRGVQKHTPSQPQILTLAGARELVNEQQQAIERQKIEQEQYEYCLERLAETHFDTSSLAKLIDNPTFFDKIHALHRNLNDEKNWTSKERENLLEELETERRFLIKHINHLIEGSRVKEEVFRNHLLDLQGLMLVLLRERHEGVEEDLRTFALQASHFPEQWLTERKIELNTKLQAEITESITKMLEAKNIGYHLDYLGAIPLMCAPLPMIPNSPHLLFGFLSGSFLGIFLMLAGLIFREIYLGPTASYVNLKSEGKLVVSFAHTMNDLKNIHYHLRAKGRVVSLITKNPSVVSDLASLFSKSGEEVCVVDLSKDDALLNLNAPEGDKEVVLGSRRFREILESQEGRILLVSNAPLQSLEVRLLIDLADHVTVVLRDERWSALPHLPEEILFVSEVTKPTPLSLKQVVPFLERVISFSFLQSSSKPQHTESHSSLEI